jgi:hypothetical protein
MEGIGSGLIWDTIPVWKRLIPEYKAGNQPPERDVRY